MFLASLSIPVLWAAFVFGTVSNGPVINQNFPGPGLMLDFSATWYAYSTTSSSELIPMSKSSDFVTWSTPISVINSIPWADEVVWAPDVREITAGHYVMYFTGHHRGGPTNDHCIGIATASTPDGPFTPNSTPHICDLTHGGAIDPSGFQAPGGALYKTPIMIQQVGANGFDLLGSPIPLITNDPIDGGLVEAPSMIFWDGWYHLFFSSNDFNSLSYDISHAVSQNVTVPFNKFMHPFLIGSVKGTAGPGGATAINVLD
ncbi:glycosyl hydrolase [Collybia nuda]|uniref:Glycosyl hydrolase n=1 Tax=Collybia nuda TaxID=64659 RepID=A0A9P5Y6A0_9AGAR|nr:glycosyl hydrolase [Collybia nuda]